MKKIFFGFVIMLFGFESIILSNSSQNQAKYKQDKEDKVLRQIREKREELEQKRDDVTSQIRKKQEQEKKKAKAEKKVLVSDTSGVSPPQSPQVFKQYFHFPPISQYSTSTCWSFSATSYFESEIFRLFGKKIKLSEMWIAYFELIEKCRRFIQERGESFVSGGGQTNSVTRIWKKYGIVPDYAYTGLPENQDRHDHDSMMEEIDNFLEYLDENNLWDDNYNLEQIKVILNKYMGKPPEKFTYQGKIMTPTEFLKETCLNLSDYYSVMSTKYFPFYTQQEFKVEDNWWHNKDYINLPLDLFYNLIKRAIQSGYTLVIGGDVSEPGKLDTRDIAFIPTFDIPGKYINQDSREYRITNHSTEDDHGVHLVGYKKYKRHDWFLVKDSGRSSRRGKHNGYYFFRGDFIKLKMLTFTVHKDMLKDILEKMKIR